MNRDEILKQAQKEANDEMVIQVKDKSIKWTYVAMVFAAAIFAFNRSEQGYPIMDLCATVSISVCVGQFYRFIKVKDKTALIIAIIMLIVSIMATIRFIMGY